MFRPLSFYIGLRYTAAKRRNHFISFISLTSMLGLMLGVAVLIIVLSVMNGFDRELKQRILGMVPHATIQGASGPLEDWEEIDRRVQEHPRVLAAAPFIQGQGMVTGGGDVRGVMLSGIVPEQEATVSIIENHFIEGNLDELKPGEFGIIIGRLMANSLRLQVGDKLTVVLPEASVTPAGVLPRLKRFTVKGIFSVGAELDGNYALIHMDDAARLMRTGGRAEGVRLLVDDLFAAPRVVNQVAQDLGGRYYVSDWTRTHGNLFQAIRMEKTMIGLLLMFIVAVAAFNIVSTLVMVVTDKTADIAILRTMGATPGRIMRIFIIQGAVIGIFGTLMGTALGIFGALNISAFISWLEGLMGHQFLSADVYFISYLPSQLQWQDVAIISSAGMVMSLLATIYPAWRASRVEPAEALRYE
ncbi:MULTISPECIES: lipoprotein-releasing ABC transporter permease subunit [Marinobacter]|jgi:lipoprotein-releasing system permease protein|uniref:ABC transporter permease n=1 Tax=Marinobacter nauticus TaxID=2743 RepID=A0A1M2UZ85_MARNT|nr:MULTISPECIES: lipoprotein-releasing ABC transporter permease subunit [Marinobacter]MDX5439936.1 lipoprotein-releasing ABC transporter permease subunit [Alteromonadaceae bacterium]WBU42950.1 lipoprotein-releasing ABC transporter permease subunit [Marinobacter alkaliphilus]MAO13796.1 lipoprotein-releasing system transmembrane subunit LolC [Marinobacter sp.]MDX5328966.1 lipoprotein-releasing ABC transporter permease subunit [Marinobacter sp.]MDX5336730.1 lipoprotein-releasing ABC transporter p